MRNMYLSALLHTTNTSTPKLLVGLLLLFFSGNIYAQNVTIAGLTNGVSASPLIAATNDHAILGFSLAKAGGGTNSVSEIIITLSQNPANVWTDARLYRSTDGTFAGVGLETEVATGSFGATSITFSGAPLTNWGGASGATTENYFVVVNIHPNVSGSATMQPSLTSGNVTVNNNSVSGSSTGTNYSFTPLTTTIGSLNAGANNVAVSPLVGGSTGQAVFGFSLSSNGSQTVTAVNIQFSSDPATRYSNYMLVRSGDADFGSAGDNVTIGSLTFTPSATQVAITGLSEDVSTAKNYFLVVDVAAAPTGTIQASLGLSNVTVNQGVVAGSATGTNYSFLTTVIGSLNAGANNVATSPLIAGTTGKAVFGFSLTSGGTQTVSEINVQLSSTPVGKLSNWSLVRSTDADFATSGDNTTIGSLTFTPSGSQVSITGLTESIISVAKNYFLVADVDPAVTGATPAIQASLGASNVVVGTGAVSGSATGTNYSFQTLITTIASLNAGANNVATSPLTAGATGKAVFGFSLTSTDNQSVTVINVQLSSDPAGKLSNWSLVRSTDADFATTGDNTTIGSLTFTPTGSQVGITGLNESITTVAKNYFLVANVDPAVTGATPAIQASLGLANVTVGTGTVSGSATGTNYTFQPLNTTIGSLNAGANNVAASPLAATSTGKAVFGFSLTSTDNQTATVINVQLSSDPAGKLSNWSLVRSTDADFASTGDNTTIGSLTFTPTGSQVGITGLNESITTVAKNYFLVADVDPAVTGATPAIQASLGLANVTVGTGTVSGSATGTNYSFAPLTATLAQLTTGIAASPLIAGTNGSISQNAILGFSLVSNGTQTVSSIKVAFNNDPAGKFTAYSLIVSTDNSFTTTGNNTVVPLSSSLVSGTGPYYVDLVPTTAIDITSIKYLFLVTSIDGSVNGVTLPPTITPSLTASDITVNLGSVTPNSFNGTTYSFQASQASTIAIHSTAGTTATIGYSLYSTQNATSGLTWGATPNSTSLANFRIRDGGGSSDSDTQDTKVTSFTITISNPQDLETVAVFYGTSVNSGNTKVGEQSVGAGTITFSVGAGTLSQALVAADNDDSYFTIRTTFKSTFTSNPDNNPHVVTVTAATVDPNGSQLSASPLTGATTGAGVNNIRIVATRLVFVDPSNLPPVNPIFAGPVFANESPQDGSIFSATVAAVDEDYNIDLDNTASITLNITPSASVTFTGGGAQALVNGMRTYPNLTINKSDTYDLGATGGALTAASIAQNTTVTVVIQSAGVTITNAADLNVCRVGTADAYTVLPNIVMTESSSADFLAGTGLTFLLVLPSGWEFKTTDVTPTMSGTPGNNFSSATFNGFLGNTIAKFTYSVAGTNKIDVVTISGLEVRNVAGIQTGVITRGGTGVIAGCCDDTKPLGTLTTTPTSSANFTVQEFPGEPQIDTATVAFSSSSLPIILNGEMPVGNPTLDGTFSGPGISFRYIGNPINDNRYTFNPSILNDGDYDITFSYNDPVEGCISSKTKTLTIFPSAIAGLSKEYCANDNSIYNISVNTQFVPSNATVVEEGGLTAYSIEIPRYKFITAVTNNGTSFTITVPNHGLVDGGSYEVIFYYGNFVGQNVFGTPPYAYIYGTFTISNVTENTFDIPVTATGNWDQTYGYVILPNDYLQISNVVNNGTSLTIHSSNHGFQNGARPYLEIGGLTVGGQPLYGFYPITNATQNTFDIQVTATGAYTYAYVDLNWYRVTSFVPNITLLNRRLSTINLYKVGYFVIYDWCTSGCDIWYATNYQDVLINPLPVVDFIGLQPSYCGSDAAVTLIGSTVDGSFTGFGVTDNGPDDNTASFFPGSVQITVNVPVDITYSYTSIKGCTGSITKQTIIQEKLDLPIASDTAYCQFYQSPILAEASGIAGATINWYDNSSLTSLFSTGEVIDTKMSSQLPTAKDFYVTQATKDACESNPVEVTVTIKPAPEASFTPPPPCIDRTFQVTGPDGVVAWDWDFGDGLTAQGQTVEHTYTSTGNKLLTLTVTAADACKNSFTQIIPVANNPTANFSFDKTCDGDVTEFHALSNGDSFEWNFGDGNTSPRLTAVDRSHQFNVLGSYAVTLRAYFNNDCYTDTTKTVPILQYLKNIDGSNPYVLADLDNGKGYWLVENIRNATWDFAIPTNNKEKIQSASAVWVTNPDGPYLSNDQSYLNSPCFDISNLSRPVISLDYIMHTVIQNQDGVVLEYSNDGGKTWTALGNTTTGQAWFNTQGFSAGSSVGVSQVGWSGNLWVGSESPNELPVAWLNGKHKLDGIPNKNYVRLRFAFGSNADTEYDGFAFTNLKIEERNRLSLVENFTHSSFGDNNTNFKNVSAAEAVKLQYHLAFPDDNDEINRANRPDPSARAAYYGIPYNTQYIPRGYIDGTSNGSFLSMGWVTTELDKRSLSTSPYNISVATVNNAGNPELLKIKVAIDKLLPVDGTPILHVGVAEKDVNENKFVLRKLLPSATGTFLEGLDTEEFEFEWAPDFPNVTLANINDLAVFAFIQDQLTKEVHQAAIDSVPAHLPLSIITGLEDPSFADKIRVYPNPANDEVNVVLPAPALSKTPIQLMDAQGRVVYEGNFSAGEQHKTIATSHFAGGMYLLQIRTRETIAIKKVIVAHQGN